ncbi:mucin-5AC-like [Ctenocephalides felis]|uniref:mucin-5AC-like n=1 Tax=Ctenocephalides felis TaxID=7515 RepID=UPI000E6E2FF1|nr:mucin-5AC-like [Ctenocephalides felis]
MGVICALLIVLCTVCMDCINSYGERSSCDFSVCQEEEELPVDCEVECEAECELVCPTEPAPECVPECADELSVSADSCGDYATFARRYTLTDNIYRDGTPEAIMADETTPLIGAMGRAPSLAISELRGGAQQDSFESAAIPLPGPPTTTLPVPYPIPLPGPPTTTLPGPPTTTLPVPYPIPLPGPRSIPIPLSGPIPLPALPPIPDSTRKSARSQVLAPYGTEALAPIGNQDQASIRTQDLTSIGTQDRFSIITLNPSLDSAPMETRAVVPMGYQAIAPMETRAAVPIGIQAIATMKTKALSPMGSQSLAPRTQTLSTTQTQTKVIKRIRNQAQSRTQAPSTSRAKAPARDPTRSQAHSDPTSARTPVWPSNRVPVPDKIIEPSKSLREPDDESELTETSSDLSSSISSDESDDNRSLFKDSADGPSGSDGEVDPPPSRVKRVSTIATSTVRSSTPSSSEQTSRTDYDIMDGSWNDNDAAPSGYLYDDGNLSSDAVDIVYSGDDSDDEVSSMVSDSIDTSSNPTSTPHNSD